MNESKEKLVNAKLLILLRYPFYGVLLCNTLLIESDKVPTIATDVKNIYWNPKFIGPLTLDETVFVLMHEIMHNVQGYFLRVQNFKHQYFNMAADYVINYQLINQQNGNQKGFGSPPKDILYQVRFKGMTTEEVYEILQKEKPKIQKTLDQHDFIEHDPSEHQELEEHMKNLVQRACSSCAPGSIPGAVQEKIKELFEPELPWEDFLESKIQSVLTIDQSFCVPSRRSSSLGVTLSGPVRNKKINLFIAIDCSASVDETMIKEVFSELQGLLSIDTEFMIHVIHFDTKVYPESYKCYTEAEQLIHTKIYGRGGTYFGAVFQFLKDFDEPLDFIVIMTDGECSFQGCETTQDVIWLINNTRNAEFNPPFGEIVKYKSKRIKCKQ